MLLFVYTTVPKRRNLFEIPLFNKLQYQSQSVYAKNIPQWDDRKNVNICKWLSDKIFFQFGLENKLER